jgi:Na+/H+ antiporter NhaC
VLADTWNMQVIIFTLFLGAMVQIMSASGGTNAVVQKLSRVTSTRERGQVLTWFMGLLIFFDDYANTMLVGNAMRPVTDRLKVSREKLAFLIDSTAAPIAGIAIVSTWVGVELGAIKDGLESLNVAEKFTNDVFIASIPYRFYPIFLIGFVVLIAATGRDYGPMLKAEKDALKGDGPDGSDEAATVKESSIWYAIAPVAVLVGWIAVGFVRGHSDPDFDSVPLLLQASFFAAMTAAVLSVSGKALTLNKAADAWMKGMTEMFPALVVLVLAWGVSSICKVEGLNTAGYIVEQLGDSISPKLMPTVAFVVSGAIAFAVGSSYATMGLLIPLFISLVGAMLASQGVESMEAAVMSNLMLSTVGAILAGSIFGDHCSPISDTTVLSSAGAGCDHLRHVATQLPYALTVGGIAIVFGYLPAGFGMKPVMLLLVGFIACVIAVFAFGRRADTEGSK